MAFLLCTASSPAESPPQSLDSPRSGMKEVDETELRQKLEMLTGETVTVALENINIT
jgi:hypothetical protein